MAPSSKCLICLHEIDEANDYFRDLDCSFPNCPGQSYHEECMIRYLRKKGNGGEQKTGFSCPATLDNGKPCSGTIRKTHIRTPTNEKKKEQSRQTAIIANQLVNAARGPQAAKPASAANQTVAPLRLKAQPINVKGTSAVAQRLNHKPVAVRNPQYDDNDDQSAAPPRGTLADFFTTAKPPAGQRNADVKAPAWSTRADDRTRPNASSDFLVLGLAPRAVANNSATAPQPVTRQRVTPGPTMTMGGGKLTSKASLEEDRARAAALRAEIKGMAARGKTAAAVNAAVVATDSAQLSSKPLKSQQQQPVQDNDNGAPVSVRKAQEAPRSVLQTSASATSSNAFAALSVSEPSSPKAPDAPAEAPEATSFQLSTDDFPQFPTAQARGGSAEGAAAKKSAAAAAPAAATRDREMTRKLSVRTSVLEPSTPPAEMEKPASGQQSYDGSPLAVASGSASAYELPAPPAFDVPAATGGVSEDTGVADADADPIVKYDLLYRGADGGYLVRGDGDTFLRVENVYGAAPEYATWEHELGKETWYIVVRQSHIDAVAAAAAAELAAVGSDGALSVGTVQAVGGDWGTQEAETDSEMMFGVGSVVVPGGDMVDHAGYVDVLSYKAQGPGAQPPLGAVSGIGQAVSGDVADEDELEDLLALCLGN